MGCRALNDSVEFLDFVRTTQNVVSRLDFTQNIFVHSWGVNPTDMIPANVSTITWLEYDPIVSFHGLILRSNHKCLRLKCIELKFIRVEEYLDIMRQDVCDKVAANYCVHNHNAFDDALSNDSDSDNSWLDRYDSD